MKTITLIKVNNFKRTVYPTMTEHGLRCECHANVIKHNRFCWWCRGMYKWEEKIKDGKSDG